MALTDFCSIDVAVLNNTYTMMSNIALSESGILLPAMCVSNGCMKNVPSCIMQRILIAPSMTTSCGHRQIAPVGSISRESGISVRSSTCSVSFMSTMPIIHQLVTSWLMPNGHDVPWLYLNFGSFHTSLTHLRHWLFTPAGVVPSVSVMCLQLVFTVRVFVSTVPL